MKIRSLALLASLGVTGSAVAVGPVGLWMLTDGDSGTDVLIQGGSVNIYAQSALAQLQYPVAWNPRYNAFMTVGRDQFGAGGVYNSSHVQIDTYLNNSSHDGQHLDGTQDLRRGITYATNWSNGDVLRYSDGDFNGPTTVVWDQADMSVFSLTYHGGRDTLFVGGNGVITEIDLNGNVMGSFATADGIVRCLAYDSADNTMWYLSFSGVDAVQIDAGGNELQRMAVNLGGNFWGGEIANPSLVPEPGTMAVLGLGAAAILRRRRK